MNILKELYHGRIPPWERKATQSTERKEVNCKIESEKRYFMAKMSLDDCQRFEALGNLYFHSSDFEQLDAFSDGFRLATMLMCAVFIDENKSA